MGNVITTCCYSESSVYSSRKINHRSSGANCAPSPAKFMPLIENLEDAFKQNCNEFEELSPNELISLWISCVEENQGEISLEDRLLISETVEHFSATMDIDNNGMVSHTEFMTYMLGGLQTRGVLGSLRGKLKKAIDNDPSVLHVILERFKLADKDGNGYIDETELVDILKSMETTIEHRITNPEVVAATYMKEMDLDGDGKIDFYEFLSYQLGRRKRPVELLLYDVSKGLSKNLSWLLIGKQFEAIYHTGVVCFGMEYWYGGSLFQNEPPMQRYFGEPLSQSVIGLQESEQECLRKKGIKVVRLGYTMYTKVEALKYLNRTLAKKYTQSSYDILSHNCNHFSDDFIYFLTGNHIPSDIKDLPHIAMQTPAAKLFRPMLNEYLGGFGDGNAEIQSDTKAEAPKLEDLPMDDNILEAISGLELNPRKCDEAYPYEDTVFAKLVKLYPKENNNKVVGYLDVRFYDPTSGDVVTLPKVPIKRLAQSLLYFNSLQPRKRCTSLTVPLTEIACGKPSKRGSQGTLAKYVEPGAAIETARSTNNMYTISVDPTHASCSSEARSTVPPAERLSFERDSQ